MLTVSLQISISTSPCRRNEHTNHNVTHAQLVEMMLTWQTVFITSTTVLLQIRIVIISTSTCRRNEHTNHNVTQLLEMMLTWQTVFITSTVVIDVGIALGVHYNQENSALKNKNYQSDTVNSETLPTIMGCSLSLLPVLSQARKRWLPSILKHLDPNTLSAVSAKVGGIVNARSASQLPRNERQVSYIQSKVKPHASTGGDEMFQSFSSFLC